MSVPEPQGDERPWRRLLRRAGVDLRAGEDTAALLLFFCFFLIVTFQYTTKSVRQSTYIDGLGAAQLPWVYLAVAVCSYPLLMLYGRFADRYARRAVMVATCALVAGSMVVFWWLFGTGATWVTVALYVWLSIVYVLTVNQFWSYSNHVFDARQAKRLFGLLGAGGLLGGVAGGQVAKIATKAVGTRATLLLGGALLFGVVALLQAVKRVDLRGEIEEPAQGASRVAQARGGLAIIRESRHLQMVAAIMVLGVVVAQIVDLQFNWAVEQRTADLDQRTSFFGNFYSIMGISALVFQLLFTARIHRGLGVGVAMRVLPTTMGLGTAGIIAAALFFPEILLLPALLLKVGENGLRYSIDQATRELLFLPVSPGALRLKAKAFIDVFVQRGAKGLAAIILLPVSLGAMTVLQSGWLALALVAVWLAVTVRARREYIQAFRASLRERSVDASFPVNLAEATTLEMLVQALGSADARQVRHALDLLASHGRGHLVPPLLLYHDDAGVRERTLEILAAANRRDAAPLVERRLADPEPEVRAAAIRVLAGLRGEDACELMLPRLREADPGVRAAAVAYLAHHGDETAQRLANGALEEMLADGDPLVRAEAAKALGAIGEPRFREALLRLHYDRDPRVVRAALDAVRRRVARDGFSPIYVPTLVSLLRSRRLKHEAREALAALGEKAMPGLVRFMNHAEEDLWVRRALPKTIARLGGAAARSALVENLGRPADPFLRRKLIDAVASLAPITEPRQVARVEAELAAEARLHLEKLADLQALGLSQKWRLEGPRLRWAREDSEPSLLERFLAEGMEDHLRNLFGLLAALHPAKHVWASYRALVGGDTAARPRALEFLDNTLQGEVRKQVFAVIDDLPLAEKLLRARKLFEVQTGSRDAAAGKWLAEAVEDGGGAEACWPALAAVYAVYSERLAALYPRVRELATGAREPALREAAVWASARLG
ncbi:MAG TPA: Npt1/Npt2 family nucleotide transporter [Thermoanaerobaculia bacterium]|nr:Npt1/Npt2 family nucleotide transporter [Thermoanaerobaculia bacterium]